MTGVLHVILVRHGDALRGSSDGSTPPPDHGLTPLGRAQARATAGYLGAVGRLELCGTLISSPARRARETADILAATYSGARAVDAAFSEIGELPDGGPEDLAAGVRRAGGALAWHWVEEHWDQLQERLPPSLVARIFDGITALVDPDVARSVRAFAGSHDLPLAGPRLDQLLERMDINVALAGRLAGVIHVALGGRVTGG